jgi:nucleoside-diphosphate kinase
LKRTLLIIKPDAVAAGHIGDIISAVERDGFRPVQLRMTVLDYDAAARLYAPHKGKPFYDSLLEFMTRGPVVACILERDDAIDRLRELLGTTDSRTAVPGTIRALYGRDEQMNAAHGSDSLESFERESRIFFENGTGGHS